MVEDALGGEVVEASLLGLELETDEGEGLPVDHADWREGAEGLSGVLQDLIVDWGVTRVHDLHCLVHGFTRPARRESDLV